MPQLPTEYKNKTGQAEDQVMETGGESSVPVDKCIRSVFSCCRLERDRDKVQKRAADDGELRWAGRQAGGHSTANQLGQLRLKATEMQN